ncbi:hypothetical protein R9C00_13350 [Flammeovirgaceae bacterium SG7u.111]|nr:hypothetical protein [Flammeovirgaceae bacterium SG7u.132]WPO38443.1 hypothetical protein R9C00_13350 [Flammeovirgaceae bacterium SG7u.111]
MKSIAIEIPNVPGEHEIEVDVRVNGVKTSYNYRVEIFKWEDCEEPQETRIECIKKIVNMYDDEWQLTHIGMPNDEYIPITFQKRMGKKTKTGDV